jgi:choline dehydrogenase
MFLFGEPVNSRVYFPGYSYNVTLNHNTSTWAILESHPRNNARTVTLRSANPLGVPGITYNYFNNGNGDHPADITAISQAIDLRRDSIEK